MFKKKKKKYLGISERKISLGKILGAQLSRPYMPTFMGL